jgi:hypothetical protein
MRQLNKIMTTTKDIIQAIIKKYSLSKNNTIPNGNYSVTINNKNFDIWITDNKIVDMNSKNIIGNLKRL